MGDSGGPGASGTGEHWRDANRAAWDERVPLHVDSAFYDTPGFLAGRNTLRDFERREVGSVEGRSLVHLQCHFGQDTLSWGRLGATVTGVDFSGAAIDTARTLALETADTLAAPATFVQADVYDAVEALGGQRFDVVYTGLGALVWLPDIDAWARVVADLLEPGGFVYLAEFHPVADVFADDALVADHDYFTRPEGTRYDEPGTYVDWDAPTTANVNYEWTHPVGAVVTALIDAGLRLDFLHEHDHTLFERWPFLERHDDGSYRLPAGSPRLPLLYSLRAARIP